ncbi:MAG: hypothetical protein KDK35_05810 [Leptospiraceae bacterium]|nr:hypothetical protein [Leptospiraceae bacterium]MCP5486899.1 hypothetical protein [Spirochaetales bacterium]
MSYKRNLVPLLSSANGIAPELQRALDVWANFAPDLLEMGITSPDQISPTMMNHLSGQLTRMIQAGQPIRHFNGAGYSNEAHQAAVGQREAARVVQEAQTAQNAGYPPKYLSPDAINAGRTLAKEMENG